MEGAQQRLASYSFLVAPVPPILNTDYQTLSTAGGMHSVDLAPAEDYFTIMATWDYGRVVAARGSESIIFVFSIMGAAPHEADAIFQSGCVSCRAKWKADLCSLVKHHLCWHGRADLCRARGIQRTCMKHNTPLMDICCGSLTPKCQRGYWLPLFFVFFQPWERGDAGSLFESPRSSTWACIIHGLATTRSVKMTPGKTGKLWLWKGWLCVLDLRNSLWKVVFWSGSPALQSVLDLLCRRCSETQENFGRLKFREPSCQFSEDMCTNAHSSQTSFCRHRW